jgi:mannitol/fructose-specific phosphotransferase system IIA component (Ntr-type)
MRLRDFLPASAVRPGLATTTRDAVLAELVAAIGLTGRRAESVTRILMRRERLGPTGVGRGMAIPHGRSLAVNRLRLAFGIHRDGIAWQSIDGRPVRAVFLIVAPPVEVANQYLPVLGRIAQFAREADVPERLAAISSAAALFDLFDAKGV